MIKKRLYNFLFLIFLFSANCFAQSNSQNTIVTKNSIVAHRGAWKKNNLPQNSIASLKEGIRLNCKASEFDIMLTADDSLVVNHDANYNNRVVQQTKFSDLATLKLSNGERLPTLREYIVSASKNNSTTLLFCEFKNYNLSVARKKIFIAKTLELVNNLNAQQLVVYSSFDYDLLKQVRSLNTEANLQYLGGNVSPDQLKLDEISEADYSYDVYYKNPQWIESAKNNNIKLNVWTVDDATNINWFLKRNFDAIITDEPELALSQTLDTIDLNIPKVDFRVFPNPTTNLITIQSNCIFNTDLELEIIDELGAIVMTKTINKGISTSSFETESFSNGVYFLKITYQERSKTFKVIVNK